MRDCPRPIARRRAGRPRAGYSLAELLITLVLVATLAALAGPKVTALRDGQSVRGARAEILSTLEAARSAAIQRGTFAWVRVRGSTIVALVDDGSATGLRVVATAPLDTLYRVTLTTGIAADTMVRFDGRGLTNPRLNRTSARWIVTARSGLRDSVCVSNLGLLLPPGCLP
jgi:prepilin-type N-terminal cleavage/methylation domain-containing protein